MTIRKKITWLFWKKKLWTYLEDTLSVGHVVISDNEPSGPPIGYNNYMYQWNSPYRIFFEFINCFLGHSQHNIISEICLSVPYSPPPYLLMNIVTYGYIPFQFSILLYLRFLGLDLLHYRSQYFLKPFFQHLGFHLINKTTNCSLNFTCQ